MRFLLRYAISAMIAGAAALPAKAGDLGVWGARLDGRLATIARLDPDRATPILAGDLRLTLPLFRGPLGLEIGLFGLASDLDTPHETYGMLTWDFGAARLALGVPRPAYDGVAVSILDRLAPLSGQTDARLAATRSRVTWGAMYGGYLPLGASARGQAGKLSWAVSAHHVGLPELSVVGLGLSWEGGDWALAGAAEWASDGGFGGKVQVVRTLGDLRFGATLFAAPLPGAEDRAEAFVAWQARPRLELTGAVQAARGSGDTLGLLAADYDLGRHQHLSLAVLTDKGQAALDLGLGWNF